MNRNPVRGRPLRAHRRDVIESLADNQPHRLQPPRPPERAIAVAIAAANPSKHIGANHGPRVRPVGHKTLLAAGMAVTAVGAAVAVLIATAPGAPPRPVADRTAKPRPHARGQQTTARQILLTAAAHVPAGPVTGKYYRVQMIGGVTVPGGTRAHPYDISVRQYADAWNPRAAGQRSWIISQQLGTRPATPVDAAAWRAAGSPASWRSGSKPAIYLSDYPLQWTGPLTATTAAAARSAAWQVSNGIVGYIEGDLAGLNAAQFRRMPAQPRQVKALLRQYARRAHCRYRGCSTVNQLIWDEALMLLQDPVSPQVRSATFKVMAGLPGVRLIGPMTDPLGRPGYAIAAGPVGANPGPSNYTPTRVILVDPSTGSLLAIAAIAPVPRTVHCLSFASSYMTRCVGSTYIGRSYQGQIVDYTAVLFDGWTNSSPVLPPPSTWSDNGCCPGLPPLP
jgi:hypothetical protein